MSEKMEALMAAQNKLLAAIATHLAEITDETQGAYGTSYEVSDVGTTVYKVPFEYDTSKGMSVDKARIAL